MLKLVVVDDEKMAREVIIGMAQRYLSDFVLSGEADSVSSAYYVINATRPDLVMLDIQLPDGTGFDLLNKFGDKIFFKVIFITAFEEFAVKAFRFSALDYLLKPIDPNEFVNSIQRAKQSLSIDIFNEGLRTLRAIYNPGSVENDTILLHTSHEVRRLFPNEIIRLAGDGNYCNVFLLAGEVIRMAKTLNWFEELLVPKGFIRTHKQHIANITYVKSFLKNEQVLLLADGSRIPVSFRKRVTVLEALGKLAGRD
ncbi:MAG: two-component system, LytTR family, response regulator [Bacteroidales bacterium]|jgi:two-component system LytT family response regulator|nr:two-component system, LytTR family, response regulator [Bacteroidales bacterium]